MLARDVLKGSNEFGLNNALVYMISDGGPAMNFGYVDCSDAAEDRVQAPQPLDDHRARPRARLLDRHRRRGGRPLPLLVPLRAALRDAPPDVLLARRIRRRAEQRAVLPPALAVHRGLHSLGVLRQRHRAVLRDEKRRARRERWEHSRHQDAQPRHLVARLARIRVSWGKARESCAFENPTMYSFISKPFYANYHNVQRWNDPDIMRRPFEMMCDPNPCLDETLDEGVEHVALCYGDRMRRGSWGDWGNTKRCLEDRGVDACRAKFAYDAGTDVDRATYSGERRGSSSYEVSFTCRVTRAGSTAEETLGSMERLVR